LLEGSGTRAIVRVVGEAAARAGVKPGMSLPVARGRCYDLVAIPDDPAIRRAGQREIAAALLAAAPRVSIFGADSFLCDASGMDKLGGEEALAGSLLETARLAGHPSAKVGVADTAVAARAATMLASVRVKHVPPGADATFLGPLPLSVLSPPPEIAEALSALGVFTCAELRALDAGSIEGRWGPEGAALHRLARGIDGRGPPPPPDGDVPTAHVDLGGPVDGTPALLFVWKPLVTRVLSGTHGRWIASLRLVLDLDDRSAIERTIEPAAPTGSSDVLVALLCGAMEKESLVSPVVAVTLQAARTVPPEPVQASLFDLDRGTRAEDEAAKDAALSRLIGRYGPDAVVRPEPVDDPLPEKRAALVPVKDPKKTKRAPPRQRPGSGPPIALRLSQTPLTVEVKTDPKGPVAVRWNGRWHRVVKRPWVESLKSPWWSEPDTERLDHRVVLEGGLLVWLSQDPKENRWRIVGWYD
jgi:protein ImuB